MEGGDKKKKKHVEFGMSWRLGSLGHSGLRLLRGFEGRLSIGESVY